MKLRTDDITTHITQPYEVVGLCHIYEPVVDNIAPVSDANETSLSFCTTLEDLMSTKAAIVIVSRKVAKGSWTSGIHNKVLIIVEDPQLALMDVLFYMLLAVVRTMTFIVGGFDGGDE